MKLLKRIGLIFFLLIIISGVGAYVGLQSKKPQYEGNVILKGLQTDVDVHFDEYGVPHIYAGSEVDAQYALGYVHAQDRLFQMEMMRRLSRGELAEILGPDLAKTDRFFRTIGVMESAKKARKAFEALPAEDPMKQAALAYYKGVNAFMETGATPLEFQLLGIPKRPFTVEDTYAIFGYMAFSFAQAFQTDPLLTRILQNHGGEYLADLDIHWDSTAQKIPVYGRNRRPEQTTAYTKPFRVSDLLESFPVAPWIGSNAWVLGPEMTQSGKVLFSNDTHMGFSQPSVWYEAHIEYPGLSLYGTYLGGVPFSVTGHTRHHAIGLTMLENDDMDFYLEELNPINPNQAKFQDEWENMQVREEIIKVKGEEDLIFDVKCTRHGPIVNEAIDHVANTTDEPVSMWWIFNEFPIRSLKASYIMGRARSMAEVREGVAIGPAPGLNVMYGDIEGNIAWWAMAKLPIRAEHVNSKLFLDGVSGEDEILGYVEFIHNPQSENPASGYVYSANNQPDTTVGILHAGYYIPQDRASRFVEQIEAGEKWDLEGMKDLVNDVHASTMLDINQVIVDQMQSNPTDDPLQLRALDILKEWDGENGLYDIAPTIYTKILYHIAKNCFQDEMGEDDFAIWLSTHMFKRTMPFLMANPSSTWWDNQNTPEAETQQDAIFQAFALGTRELEAQFGSSDPQDWQWYKVHTIEHPHALAAEEKLRPLFNVGPFPVNGNIETVNNMMFALEGDGTYEVKAGPAKRRIIDFSDLEHALSVLPTGQSGVMMSPHYSDQAQMFVDGEFRQMKMNEGEIKKEGGRKLVFEAE